MIYRCRSMCIHILLVSSEWTWKCNFDTRHNKDQGVDLWRNSTDEMITNAWWSHQLAPCNKPHLGYLRTREPCTKATLTSPTITIKFLLTRFSMIKSENKSLCRRLQSIFFFLFACGTEYYHDCWQLRWPLKSWIMHNAIGQRRAEILRRPTCAIKIARRTSSQ
jgi:hypothetical protein